MVLRARSGNQGHRLLRHHLPVAIVSLVVLLLFMTFPAFDTSADHGAVDISSGALPQARGEPRPSDHATEQPAEPSNRTGGQPGPTDHDGGQGGATHGGEQGGATHGGEQGGSAHESGAQPQPEDEDEPMQMTGNRVFIQRLTVATGYVATGLLAVTLLIGPANLLLRRRNPVSSYFRRDVGAWTALFSVAHVAVGLQVHGPLSGFVSYFFAPDGSPWLNSFGLGNWTGLAATVIVVGLFALSSDLALRSFKARPWKRLQRLNYVLFALVVAHAFFYGALLRTTSPFTLLLVVSAIAVSVGQLVGVILWRRRSARSVSAT